MTLYISGKMPTTTFVNVARTPASGSQPFPSTAYTKIAYDAKREDNLGEWNNNLFTAKSAGVYAVTVNYDFSVTNSASSTCVLYLYINDNSTNAKTFMRTHSANGTSINHQGSSTLIVKLAANDTLQVVFSVGQLTVNSVSALYDANALTIVRVA